MDNCTSNDLLIEILKDSLLPSSLIMQGEFFHMRCCAHILNLIVKDGLEVIGDGIERVRESVAFWTATPKRVEKFEELAKQEGFENGKKLALDCKTRWNSTYIMLETALIYKDVFPRLRLRDSNYKCLPTEEDWSRAKEICGKLEIFYSVTSLFSGTKYPTANQYFPYICSILSNLHEWIDSPFSSNLVRSMAEKMLVKFNKYWSVIHGIMGVACVLDPRYKLTMLEVAYNEIHENASDEVQRIRDICYSLLREYQSRSRSEISQSDSFQTSSSIVAETSISNTSSTSNFFKKFDTLAAIKRKTNLLVKSELDMYFEEDILPRMEDFDILGWWRNNGLKYPTLQLIARDILAIPVSTVASESAFSIGGRIVNPNRNRLTSETLEALMCARNWLWAELEGKSYI